jgi:hypothetical protein
MYKVAGHKNHSRRAIALRAGQYALYLCAGRGRHVYLPMAALCTLVIVKYHRLSLPRCVL